MSILSIIGLILSALFGISGIISWINTTKAMSKINTNIEDNKKLISSTTDLLEVSSKIGITAAHVNREVALQKFDFVNDKILIVVGSSLKGLKMFVPNLEPILKARTELGLVNRFLLTHPCRSKYREHQETRSNGEIKSEIDEMVEFLMRLGIKNNDIRFYLGTPTNFLLITSEKMIINPYPYQIEAYRCFCLEVERKPILNIKEQKPQLLSDLNDSPAANTAKIGEEFFLEIRAQGKPQPQVTWLLNGQELSKNSQDYDIVITEDGYYRIVFHHFDVF